MFGMPMNRHMTWGDRQADAARLKNLEKVRKLAASAPGAEPAPEPETPAASAAPAKPKSTPAKTAKAPAKSAAKKAKPAAAKKKTKK